MIRQAEPEETDALIELWLACTIQAHPFIKESYWRESESMVRNVYMPQSLTWVYREGEAMVGFISVLNQRFIGALFVAEPFYSKDIGSKLIEHVKARFSALSLEVYQENRRAVHFYQRRGFAIEETAWQQETGHPTWIIKRRN